MASTPDHVQGYHFAVAIEVLPYASTSPFLDLGLVRPPDSRLHQPFDSAPRCGVLNRDEDCQYDGQVTVARNY